MCEGEHEEGWKEGENREREWRGEAEGGVKGNRSEGRCEG